jgi:hypothetical protein
MNTPHDLHSASCKDSACLKVKGVSTHRFRDNPEELRFAQAWDDQNKYGHHLAHLLDTRSVHTGEPPPVSERDEVVAATVIQWLGSPVGQAFLRDLGYVRND